MKKTTVPQSRAARTAERPPPTLIDLRSEGRAVALFGVTLLFAAEERRQRVDQFYRGGDSEAEQAAFLREARVDSILSGDVGLGGYPRSRDEPR